MQHPDRIEVVDVLRAVALCGIAITHAEMGFLAGPPPTDDFMAFGVLDVTASRWVDILVESKFFSIFSFLFGLSFAIQLSNTSRKASAFAGRFAWRLVLLFGIGALHQLLFNGDILMIYAALGLLLIPLARARSGVLLVVALLLVCNVPGLIQSAAQRSAGPPPAAENARLAEIYGVGGQRLFEANKHGSLRELARVNYTHGLAMKWEYQSSTGRLWITFGCFLLGMVAGRAQLFTDNDSNRRFFRRVLWFAGIGAGGCTALALGFRPSGWVAGLFMDFAASLQKVALAAAVVLGVVVFAAQVFVARAWMARHRFGPVEWLWRSATCLKWQPLNSKAVSSA